MSDIPSSNITNNINSSNDNSSSQQTTAMSNTKEDSSSSEEKRPTEDEGSRGPCEDVAQFDGKIVYNPDGSAYIIDGDDEGIPCCQEGSIVEKREGSSEREGKYVYPQIAKAIYVTQKQARVPESSSPLIHSYRVYSLRGDPMPNAEEDSEEVLKKAGLGVAATVPVKPILMCFICKLSFGFAKSFINHCAAEHALELREEERIILEAKNSSAIIQIVGKEKAPIVSFLEPDTKKDEEPKKRPSSEADNPQQMLSPSAIKGILSAALSNAVAAAAAANSDKQPEAELPLHPPHFPPGSFLDSLSPSVRNSLLEMNRQANGGGGRSSISPGTSNSLSCSPSPSLPPLPPGFNVPLTTNANMLQGTTIGACPDHVNGRPTGVECAKCDIILKASHMPGGLAWNAARNSCKTLKCPKCNWHYKYQETLDIHMKEKHPENETTCIYCITGQQHPRLARGETYTCGYKPYRCEVCNYSTTTKGNLSIHMQSDKHLNNMQELQNGGVVSSPDGSNKTIPSSVGGPLGSSPLIPKQKPSWRCDVCNYETNVARNLRIHMTSEKHTHNIMVLQQNVKQMQQLSGGAPPPLPLMFGPGGMPDPQMLQLQLAAGIPPFNPEGKSSQPEAAMADLAYFQAVMMQMMTGGQFPPGPVPADFSGPPSSPMNEEALEPPPEPADPNPKCLFTCCVCRDFGGDSLEHLSQHLTLDRTKTREHEVSMVIGGNYICKLCSYKTNLKANFQLHCKTDKHLQRLNHVNHIKEGGPANEWRLKFLNVTNPVQLRCNACDYYTNSLHKLQLHTANQRHEISTVLFSHLKAAEAGIPEDRRSYSCSLCKFESPGKTGLMAHVRSIKHLQMEQIHQLQKKSEGNPSNTEIGEIFQVLENVPDSSSKAAEEPRVVPPHPPSNTTSSSDDPSKGPESGEEKARGKNESSASTTTPCPLCQEPFQEYSLLEAHVSSIHSVNSEGLQRLLLLMEGSHWLNNNQNNRSSSSSSMEDSSKGIETTSDNKTDEVMIDEDSEKKDLHSSSPTGNSRKTEKGSNHYPMEKYLDPNRPYKCDVCKESFTQKNILLVHYNSVSHLHRLKRSMSGKLEAEGPPAAGTALEAALGNIMNKQQKDLDEEVKPYKCNICKVAYSQGSTLDIHIRSLLHQNRASKLQELAMTGQIDLSKPLIEQPEGKTPPSNERKRLPESSSSSSPKSLNSSGNSNHVSSPNIASLESPCSSPLNSFPPPFLPGSSVPKSLNDLFLLKGGGGEGLSPQQQQLAKLLQAFPGLASPNSSFGDDKAFPSLSPDNKKSSHVLKNLLQNYGFELVMQFNEYHQRRRLEEEERRRKKEAEAAALENAPKSEQEQDEEEEHAPTESKRARKSDDYENVKSKDEEEREVREKESTPPPTPDTPPSNNSEGKKSTCPICKKEFSSIWVLKAHSEEIHKDAVPPEFLEKFVEEFKSNLEKKDEEPPLSSNTSIDKISPIKDQIPSSFLTPEKSIDEGTHPMEASTPKSRSSTPLNSNKNNVVNSSESDAAPQTSSMIPTSSSSGPSGPPPTSGSDMQSMLQQAMLSSSSSKSGINPMMLQMAQLQGMNPLLAMNLHPPLIPPAMLSNGNTVGTNTSSSTSSSVDRMNLLSQFQNTLPGMVDPHSHLLNQLGFDSKLLMKTTGSADSFLENSKKLITGGIDPKLLSMFVSSASKDGPGFPHLPPNPLLNMGLDPKLVSGPSGPDPKLLLHLAQGLDPSKFLPGSLPSSNPANSGLGSDPSSLVMNPSKTSTVFQQPEQQKRARTRITDEQLKILRSNFDINNSPTEAATAKMSQQTGLPPKVIKHWFRNTLFKERQRNKDSPYNFSNPPSTMLNLEEYEKTGESKVTALNPDEQKKYSPSAPIVPERRISSGEGEEGGSKLGAEESRASPALSAPSSTCTTPNSGSDILRIKKEEILKKESEDPETPPVSSSSLTLSNILGSQMNHSSHQTGAGFLTSPFSNFGGGGGGSGSGSNNSPLGGGSSGFPDFLNPLGNMMPDKSGSRSRSPSGGSSHNQGKRANRTRFTDYQIKVLQEFFENNAYPKDDDLEYLSKLLSLSPRVIVVWFQNARQKARKIYENQPPIDPTEDGAGRFTRTPGLNYQCKKCLLVFQRYYELIRHQKQHCFKEEDAKRSAQAQKAAAQAAAQFSGQSPNNFNVNNSTHSDDSNSSGGVAPLDRSCMDSPMFNQSSSISETNHRSFDTSDDWVGEGNFSMFRGKEEEKKITPSMFDQLIREDPFAKFVNRQSSPSSNFSGGGSNLFPNYPPVTSTPFVMNTRDRDSDDVDTESIDSSPSSSKRKLSEDGDFLDEKDESGQPRDKRLRTTILPEQLDFLYQKYQVESNPSRKMLEQIANEVGLRKRVVQVWFQNTRARERKGQFRAHQQVINKRCPYCPALFKVRSALESHLATKHSDQYTRGEINIDALPDAEGGPPSIDEGDSRSILGHPLTPTSSVSGGGPIGGGGSDLEVSMRKYYEDTMKRYMNDLQSNKRTPPLTGSASTSSLIPSEPTHEGNHHSNHVSNNNATPLDLTGPALDLSGGAKSENADSWDEGSENASGAAFDEVDGEDPNCSSPGDVAGYRNGGHGGDCSSKRFRTQMSSLQVKMMKSIFTFYKTPTMNECSELGRQIGLQKRVVQVWFQNARAKEKKARLQLQQSTGVDPETPPPPSECSVCNFKFTHGVMLQDHIFRKSHQDNVKIAITAGRYDPESPGFALNQLLLSLSEGGKNPEGEPLTNSSEHPARSSPPPHSPLSKHSSDASNRDEMEKTLMQQLYGVGHGISSYPSGVATANPFLHPAMFSATGK